MSTSHRFLSLLLSLVLTLLAPTLSQTGDWEAQQRAVQSLLQEERTQEAVELARNSWKLAEERFGPHHLNTAMSLSTLSQSLQACGRLQQARAHQERAVALSREAMGSGSFSTAAFLTGLANLQSRLGEREEAVLSYRECLEIYRTLKGEKHPETLVFLKAIARLKGELGQNERAAELYLQAAEIERHSERPELAVSTLTQAGFLLEQGGEYRSAFPFFQAAHQAAQNLLGASDPVTLQALSNLASLHELLGEHSRALLLLETSLRLHRETLGEEHPSTATCLHNLGYVHESIGDFLQSKELYSQALSILRDSLGPEHPKTGLAHNNLATVCESLELWEEAEHHLLRALEISRKALGEKAVQTAGAYHNLGSYYQGQGENERAAAFLHRALEGPGLKGLKRAVALNNLGIQERSLGRYKLAQEHLLAAERLFSGSGTAPASELASNWRNLAYLKIDMGESEQAVDYAGRAAEAELRETEEVFRFSSERQRAAFRQTFRPFELPASLGRAEPTALALLRYKGLVLDSMVEDARRVEASKDATLKGELEQLRRLKSRLLKAPEEGEGELSRSLRENIEQLETKLARAVTGLGRSRQAFSVSVESVQKALPPRTVLIEFVRYDHYLGNGSWEARYGAVLLSSIESPRWVVLPGSAESLEESLRAYQRLMRGASETRASRVLVQKASEDLSGELLSKLYRSVWLPVASGLPEGTDTVIVSPDGELNFLSFATLLGPDERFLCEDLVICYVSSGRDLLDTESAPSRRSMVLLGDPEFGEGSSLVFAPLPHTRTECEQLAKLFAGERPKLLLGAEARERTLRDLSPPKWLHIATHGFFVKGTGDPMKGSGLALCGAQSPGESGSSDDEDGLWTAAEVGTKDLSGTELVTLSACDTASGEAQAGVGVLGLRRGFVQAGAGSLLMTLWPVADRETALLMQDFYAETKRRPLPLALHRVQRDWLKELRRQGFSLRDTVRLAGPFILTFRGPLRAEKP